MRRIVIFFLLAATLFASSCDTLFSAPLNSTSNQISILNNAQIKNGSLLQTAKLSSQNNSCNGVVCTATGNYAASYTLPTKPLATYANNLDIKQDSSYTIFSNTNLSNLTIGQNSTLNINGNVAINIDKSFKTDQNTKIIINGNAILYTNLFLLGNNSSIIIKSGSLQIYSYGTVNIGQNGQLNQNANSSNLFIGVQNDIVFEQNTKANLFLYSNGQFDSSQNSMISGSIASAGMLIGQNTAMVYDKNSVSQIANISFCEANNQGGYNIAGFNAWESQLSAGNAKIYHKFASQNFSLKIGAFDSNSVQKESNDIVDIYAINSSGANMYLGQIAFSGQKEVLANFQINDAFLNLKLKFINQNRLGACANGCLSNDFFSIRPAFFIANALNLTQIAGTPFNLNLLALNANNAKTVNYNGMFSSALNTNAKSGCVTPDALVANQKNFIAGEYLGSVKLNDVGDYILQDTTWLSSDKCVANSSSNLQDTNGKIGCNTALANQITSKLFDFKFSELKFNQNSRDYTYILKDSNASFVNMNTELTGKLEARACDNTNCTTAKNYSTGCYSNFDTLTLTLPNSLNATLTKYDNLTSSNTKELGFNSGILNIKDIKFGFIGSSSKAIAPIEVNSTNAIFTITDPINSITAQSKESDFDINSSKVVFVYPRINIPTQVCYSLSCDNFRAQIEIYAPTPSLLPYITTSSVSGNGWQVPLVNDSSDFALIYPAGFTQILSPSINGTDRVFGVKAQNTPSTCIVRADIKNAPWLKYRTNIVGEISFEQTTNSGWSGFGNKSQNVILENGLPGYIRIEKINK
ncbi:MAG: hypothetical protein RL154_954 [Pseudomonadota bacterium]